MRPSTVYVERAALDEWFASHQEFDTDTSWCGFSMDGGDVFHIGSRLFAPHMAGRPARVHLRKCGPAAASSPSGLAGEAMKVAGEAGVPVALVECVANERGYIPQAATADASGPGAADLRYLAIDSDLQSRARGLLPAGSLVSRRVAVVGVGSGGSTIALELAKAGVGQFVLIDHDRLEVANVARHVCGLGDVGRRKTFAVRDVIAARNPSAVVETHEFDILDDPDRLRSVVAGANLLVGATDSDPSRAVINRVAVEQNITALFGRVLAGAYAGDVLRVRPNVGACLGCVFTAAVRAAKPREIKGFRDARAAFPAYTDAAALEQVIQVGLAADIAPVAIFMVKLALTELLRGQVGPNASLETDFQSDFYTWVNRRERLYKNFAALGQGLPNIMSWIPGPADRRRECSVCGSGIFPSSLSGAWEAPAH